MSGFLPHCRSVLMVFYKCEFRVPLGSDFSSQKRKSPKETDFKT